MPFGREKAWAVAIARDVASAIPDAVQNVRGLNLTPQQVLALQTAFESRLVRTMGEDSDETPRSAASRNEK